jgi:hypothetical protein
MDANKLKEKFAEIKPLAEKAATEIKKIPLMSDYSKYSTMSPINAYDQDSGYWFKFPYAAMMTSDPSEYGGGGYYYKITPAQKREADGIIRKLNTIAKRFSGENLRKDHDGGGDYFTFRIPLVK